MEEQEYLEPGFDPASLTIPRLRSVLVAHGINYPASAKKGQLVEIFNDTVVPQARRLRAASARVKRTSRGIEDVPSQGSSIRDEEEEEEPRPLKTPGRTPRRTTRARTEEAQEVQAQLRSSRHSTAPPEATPRRSSSKHARNAEAEHLRTEPEPKRPASRKSRVGTTTPAAKRDSDDGESPFSSENVFQSGGSPPATSSGERRRTTFGASRPSRSVDRSRNQDVRRRTDEHRQLREQRDGAIVPTRKTFEMPVARVKREQASEAIEPTEEFTHEEQQALTHEQQSGALVPTRRKPRAKASGAAKTGLSAVFTVVLAAVATLWSQEKFQVGYCGVGYPSNEIAGVKVPEWADALRPVCEPCPPHAYCHENLETVCEPGFVLTSHPLSLAGKIPLPPTCEPDSARTRKVQAVKERAVEELRERNAKYECGEASKPEVKETELKKTIATRRRRDMSNEEFEDLWSSALGELQGAEEIVSGSDGIGNSILRSTSLAKVPLACAIRRSLRQTLRRYVWTLVMILAIASSGAYGRHRITASRSTEARAKELASIALGKLSEQASLHAAEPSRWEEGYISVAQLRDDVLRDEFSATRRRNVWEKVQKKVEGNANVRPMVREGRGGDVGRVWEWIGAVGAIEGTPGDRRRSGGYRDSLGGIAGQKLIEPGSAEPQGSGKVVRWEEQRQYY